MTEELLLIPEQHRGPFHLKQQYVSFTDGKKELAEILSREDYHLLLSLYECCLKPSKKDLFSLELLVSTYPKTPQLKNLLTFFYLRRKQIKKAERLVIETYKAHPDHLIAKINYGDYCLRKKKIDQIPLMFSHTFDLRLLYPSKTVFQMEEFRGFMTLMGFYHHAIGQQEQALCYHYLASRVDPRHPAVLLLGRTLLYTPLFKKMINLFKKYY